MTSTQTAPVFIHTGTWDDTTRNHPAMKWMEDYCIEFDKGTFQPTWYTSGLLFHKANGEVVKGRDQAIAAMKQLYSPLTAHFHEPTYISCCETSNGWEMIAQATLFGNLSGNPAEGEEKKKDKSGREWDIAVPSGFHVHYVKGGDNGGLLIDKAEIMSDSGVPMGIMLKRGLIGARDLGL